DSNGITGWGSSHYLVGPSTLTLTGLPTHLGAVVNFDIYALDKWDGNHSPSSFTLTANGTTEVDTSFSNAWNEGTVSYDECCVPETCISPQEWTQDYPASLGNGCNNYQTGAIAEGDMDSDCSSVCSYCITCS